MPAANTRQRIGWVAFAARQPEPEHIHRRRGGNGIKVAQPPQPREAPVTANRQRRTQLVPSVLATVAHATHHIALHHQLLHPRPHYELEGWIARRLRGEVFEETLLWH